LTELNGLKLQSKIVIHVGLPKTATTSLQTGLFPYISKEYVEYLGVFQPRGTKNEHELYSVLVGYIRNGGDVNLVRNLLINKLSEGKVLLLSEEMIVVGAKWRECLERLGAALKGLNYQIVVTVREPAEALFSYYCEQYKYYLSKNVSFFDAAMDMEEMMIFHYEILLGALKKSFDINRVIFFSFEDITQGRLSGLLRSICDVDFEKHIMIHENSRVKIGNQISTQHFYTLLDPMRVVLYRVPVMSRAASVVKRIEFLAKIISLIDRVKLKQHKVTRPSEQEFTRLRNFLANGRSALYASSGINYTSK
jgi:hypothetical protein